MNDNATFSNEDTADEMEVPFTGSSIVPLDVIKPQMIRDVRELWKHERFDFSAWLGGKLDWLGEALNMKLELVRQEQPAGDFSIDIVARDGSGGLVVIENQLERTDHDHLGKVLTYMANINAKTAVWIAAEVREEHKKAVMWLNESTSEEFDFYLVRLEAFRVGDSKPGLFFRVVAGPSAEAKAIGKVRDNIDDAERHVLRHKFWTLLVERLKVKKIKMHSNIAPTLTNELGTRSGNIIFKYLIWLKGKSGIEIYIDSSIKELNKQIYDHLASHREQIEEQFGHSLEWNRHDDKQISSIRYYIEIGGLKDGEDAWTGIQDLMIAKMDSLFKVLATYIQSAPKQAI